MGPTVESYSEDPSSDGRSKSRNGDREMSPTAIYNPFYTGRPRTPSNVTKSETPNRQEIIRKIKEKGIARQRSIETHNISADVSPRSARGQTLENPPTPSLLPSPHIQSLHPTIEEGPSDWNAAGQTITRPRSALHSGDFHGLPQEHEQRQETRPPSPRLPISSYVATSPPAPWHEGFPNTSIHRARRQVVPSQTVAFPHPTRPRTVSQVSLAKSFSYQQPTSPLVNQSNAEDITDLEQLPLPRPDFANDQFSRRRTISPRSLQGFAASLNEGHGSHWSSSPPAIRRENTVPYKAHQPRRSITSTGSLPQTPLISSRRTSWFGSSPVQNAMVGSFEESILRGRMSSTPSQPLDFTAHIGVLGVGDCKPSLRCPPHIVVPFPAVFYSYGHTKTTHDSQPSPYVGLIDLEKSSVADATEPRKKQRTSARSSRATSPTTMGDQIDDSKDIRRKKLKDKRRSVAMMDMPRGAYRIPSKGQLQIIIKNPNKTAVKLFLVPFDVTDIHPGQKTFIRQRSYSAGPIVDMPVDVKPRSPMDVLEMSNASTGPLLDKPVLRYMIHLHICCTAKGRVYLYKNIRVVFANRVPDGKEKLRSDTQLPDPKYSIYKPNKMPGPSTSLTQDGQGVSTRMNLDTPTTPVTARFTGFDVAQPRQEPRSLPTTNLYDNLYPHRYTEPSFRFPLLDTVASRPASREAPCEDDTSRPQTDGQPPALDSIQRSTPPRLPLSPTSPLFAAMSPLQRAISPTADSSDGTEMMTFTRTSSNEKLPGSAVQAESLLSRRLRDLEVKGRRQREGNVAGGGEGE